MEVDRFHSNGLHCKILTEHRPIGVLHIIIAIIAGLKITLFFQLNTVPAALNSIIMRFDLGYVDNICIIYQNCSSGKEN